jgi:PQQ-like domain
MSEQFTTKLQLQLREAAQREERRNSLGRRLADVRLGMPGPRALGAAALVAAAVLALVLVGGLRWGTENTTVGPHVVTDVALADNLGQISCGFGSVWASDRNGGVLRIDPRTHTVRQRIQVGGYDNAPGGNPLLNAGAGAVWVIAQPTSVERPARLLRIDPATGKVTARLQPRHPDGSVFPTADVQFLGGVPYLIGSDGALELDPATGRTVRYIKTELPAGEPFPLWLTGDDENLWLLTRDQRIVRYGLRSGRPEHTILMRLPAALGLVPTKAGLLLANGSGDIALVNRDDGGIEWQRPLGTAVNVPLVVGDTVYVHTVALGGGRDEIAVLDLHSGEIRSTVVLPQFGLAGMTVVGDDLWLSTPGGHVMILNR